MQGTQIRPLVREDGTCREATIACAPKLLNHVLQPLKPMHLEPVLCNGRKHHSEKSVHRDEQQPCSLQLEKARAQQQRPSAAKNK